MASGPSSGDGVQASAHERGSVPKQPSTVAATTMPSATARSTRPVSEICLCHRGRSRRSRSPERTDRCWRSLARCDRRRGDRSLVRRTSVSARSWSVCRPLTKLWVWQQNGSPFGVVENAQTQSRQLRLRPVSRHPCRPARLLIAFQSTEASACKRRSPGPIGPQETGLGDHDSVGAAQLDALTPSARRRVGGSQHECARVQNRSRRASSRSAPTGEYWLKCDAPISGRQARAAPGR